MGLDPVRIDWTDMMTETAASKTREALVRGAKALERGDTFRGTFVRLDRKSVV